MAMTAHVLYPALDPKNAATVSRTIVQDVIRGHIGFDGLLMTDDLSMKALQGSLAERAERALEAGCDIVLHCNGDMSEMKEIAPVCPPVEGEAARRAAAAIKARKSPLEKINLAEAHARFSAMLTA
jgi:beta-N-acetylhexosaminidase